MYLTIAIVSVAALLIAFVAFIQFSRHKSAKKQVRILQLESLNKDIQMRSEEELECIKKEIEKLSECNSEHISEIQKQREELMYYKNIVEHNIVLYQEKKLTLDKSETVKELKDMLGIGITLAYRLVKNNNIKSLKIGREYKIPKANVISYLTTND